MELLPFGSCCAGAPRTPTAKPAASPLPVKRAGSGQATKVKPRTWKPALSGIAEDSVVSEIGRKQNDKGMVRTQKKKASDKATSRGDNASYWFLDRLHFLDNLFKRRKVSTGIEPHASATELRERYAYTYL